MAYQRSLPFHDLHLRGRSLEHHAPMNAAIKLALVLLVALIALVVVFFLRNH